jgi:hypothetical protein
MEVIEIREDVGRSGAVLRMDGYDYPVTVASPFGAEQLRELDWYFEEHLRFPFTDQVRARQAGDCITAYGEALFGQLFAGDEAREAYGALKRRAYPDQLAVAVIGSPAFQGLHWEALRDPKLPRPFALDVPIMRRRTASAPVIEAVAANSPTLNLLVLTARPAEAYDVGYRTITRPLVATLRLSPLPHVRPTVKGLQPAVDFLSLAGFQNLLFFLWCSEDPRLHRQGRRNAGQDVKKYPDVPLSGRDLNDVVRNRAAS